MKLRPPRQVTWWIALGLGVLGILLHLKVIPLPNLGELAFWGLVIALGLLLLATRIRGL